MQLLSPRLLVIFMLLGSIVSAENERLSALRKKADLGAADAQFEIGLLYADGDGVPKDWSEAARWYLKAAEQGHLIAQNNLGTIYMVGGHGLAKNETEGFRWHLKAAVSGVATAQFDLSLQYSEGRGVEKDNVEAAKWMRKAAEKGIPEAALNTGLNYRDGDGVIKDILEAHAWTNLAAAFGNEMAKLLLPQLEEKMTSDQIAEATKLAHERFEKIKGKPYILH